MTIGRFEVYDTDDGSWAWLCGLDGQPLLRAGPLTDAAACVAVVQRLKTLGGSDSAYRQRDAAHGFCFVVVDEEDGTTLAESEVYGTAVERDMAMITVRLLAITAPLIVRRSSG